ncbi:aldo/keto reductase [Companilactobacillus allii]|uniref:Aldo/keto reductase n=1 Tax=Companilactobacillus allii TaxID=1847728 RepID=A0A1P8Q2Z7_9LACO|nr:aldo/keto reductase [Companilactobacillus allii]APX72243.1 aldo/keto reductase [Companilactobacillus allii]USQ69336.1 aldo/keto reductase [Companilactobacillus allii]
MRQIQFNDQPTSIIGMGTWRIGEDPSKGSAEIQTIQYGLNHGITLIDTAEMYGEGAAETLVGEAIKDFDRQKFQLVSKFYPYHATPKLIKNSLEHSLKRLQTDYLDLYLLHWRGETPLAETISGLVDMKKAGYIKDFGVSNFDINDLKELYSVPNGDQCKVNQNLYNIGSRGIEYSILPWQKEHDISFMGYSPFGSDKNAYLHPQEIITDMANQKHITIFQLLLAWVIRNNDLLSIAKTSSLEHLKDNLGSIDVRFTDDELELLDKYYPAPTKETPLDVI